MDGEIKEIPPGDPGIHSRGDFGYDPDVSMYRPDAKIPDQGAAGTSVGSPSQTRRPRALAKKPSLIQEPNKTEKPDVPSRNHDVEVAKNWMPWDPNLSENQHTGDRSKPRVIELQVPMCCDGCEKKVREVIEDMTGVKKVDCDQGKSRVTVTGFISPSMILRRVQKVKKRSVLLSFEDDEVLLNRILQQRKPSFGKPRSKVAEDIVRLAPLDGKPFGKSTLGYLPGKQLLCSQPSLFYKPQDLQSKDNFKREVMQPIDNSYLPNHLAKVGTKEEKGADEIYQEHEAIPKAATTKLDKTEEDRGVLECWESLKVALSSLQNNRGIDPNKSKYFDLLKGERHAWLDETFFEVQKLFEMLNNHPELLMEVCPKTQRTILHVAVMANSPNLLEKVPYMINNYANKAMKEVSPDNSIQDHRSKIWEFIFTIERASNYTASELGAVLGIKQFVKMDDDSELYNGVNRSTSLQSSASCSCANSKETTLILSPLENNGRKEGSKKDDADEIAKLLLKELCQQDGGKLFLPKGSQLLGKEFSLHAFIAASVCSNGFLSWELKHDVGNFLKGIISKLADKNLLPALLRLGDQHGGKTLLHYLAEYNSGSCIFTTLMEELKKYYSTLDVNIKDNAGRTPLHYGAACGSIEVVNFFVDDDNTRLDEKFVMENIWVDKFNANSKQHVCLNALALAMNHDHASIAETLLSQAKGVYDNVECTQYIKVHPGEHIPKTWISLHQSSSEYVSKSWTPLQLAAWKGHLKILQMLLKDPNVKDYGFEGLGKKDDKKGEGAPALHVAALGAKLHAVKALLKSERVNPFALDSEGNTALHYATIAYDCEDIKDGPWNFVSISHLHGYPKWKRNKKPKSIAEIIGCLELLVQAGLNMNQKNKEELTPQFGPQTPDEIRQWWYDKLAKEARDWKGNIILATNAVSVIGALVAATSFVGPLQPPLGLSSNSEEMWLFGYSQVNHVAVDIFFFFDSISFYLAIASILLALISNLPIPGEGLLIEVERNQRNLQGAVILLFTSIIFIICAFGAASIAVIPEGRWNYKVITISTTIFGGVVCLLVFYSFFKRLWKIKWLD